MDLKRFSQISSGIILAVVLLTAFTSTVWAGTFSYENAIDITTDTLLEGTTDGTRLFYHPEPVSAGDPINHWKNEPLFHAPARGWFVFIDRLPGANWEHPCSYVFVSESTGELTTVDATFPPANYLELTEVTDGFDNPSPEASAKMHAWFDQALIDAPKPPPGNRGMAKALIISGGASAGSNHIRYWNDCSFIYKTLVNYYGYFDENIWVLISDGLNPAPDISNGTNSNPDLDGDGDDDIMYPATLPYVDQVFTELANTLSPSDQLFIFTTDHGGSAGGWDAYLNLWDGQELHDEVMAAYIDALPCETLICTFEQCFSGGMLDDLWGVDGRVLSSAARHDEYSWAMPPDYIYDTYVYHWTCAVAWQDPSGNPIDADTNDDGIVSMIEAFTYAEAHDFDDETPQYYSTPEDLGNIMNLMGSLEGIYLSVNDCVIDDDTEGASMGNGNGILEYGETAELWVTLKNMGQTDAFDIVGTLTDDSPFAGVTMQGGEVEFGAVFADGTTAGSTPFVVQVVGNVPDGADLNLNLALNEEPGNMGLGLSASAPKYVVGIIDIDDSSGDNDGIADPGERVELTLSIENAGSAATPNLSARLSAVPSQFQTDLTPHDLGVLQPGQLIEEAGFTVTITGDCPANFSHYLVLDLVERADYYAHLAIPFYVGGGFADAMEQGGDAWVHSAEPGWVDQWHLETERNHSDGGTTSWKCGGMGGADYANNSYGRLETAPFDLPPSMIMSFWHWSEIETQSSTRAWDAGFLEISDNDGLSWSLLTPEGGYPYTTYGSPPSSPFPQSTPCWSGNHGWEQVHVDLSGYSGSVKLRWNFGTDGSVTYEGWYIDDVMIANLLPSGANDHNQQIIRPELITVGPNPLHVGGALADGMAIRYALPADSQVRIELYDATGRMVRQLASGAAYRGTYEVVWDGRDSGGLPVSSGTYYCRLAVDGKESIKPVTVIR
jgi:FlgD Ig-like domain/Peptidase C13 family